MTIFNYTSHFEQPFMNETHHAREQSSAFSHEIIFFDLARPHTATHDQELNHMLTLDLDRIARIRLHHGFSAPALTNLAEKLLLVINVKLDYNAIRPTGHGRKC